MMNMAQLTASKAAAEIPGATLNTGINPVVDPLAATAQVQPAGMETSATVDPGLAAAYAAMAAAPDPLNNAVTPKQQNTLGAINANKFTRDNLAMQNLV
jgi:hypothetical protein|tara:strand:+ start:40 stop:336 length:297 start_codon:yes stop_codon:yes gene_type:complete